MFDFTAENSSEQYHPVRMSQTPSFALHHGDALDAYPEWKTPSTIVSDGAYGVGGFPGDPRTPERLADWYRPHIEAWSNSASLSSTLWFWNTEVGWANVHPVLVENGWDYVQCVTWDKGISHIAGNVNGSTIRRFPVVTEVCVFYSRRPMMPTEGEPMHAREWMRYEWKRSGLAMRLANEACGVKDAATRKYFAKDWLWYPPPPETMVLLARYANEHGAPTDRPYYSLDGINEVTASDWSKIRYQWTHEHGLTNVWQLNSLHGRERIKGNEKRSAPRVYKPTKASAVHLNQKPLEFMRRIVVATTQPGETVWEPFGGLCSASVAALELGRNSFAAEPHDEFFELASDRLERALGHVDETGQSFLEI